MVNIKPKKILCVILILLIGTSTFVYAEDPVLTLQNALDTALKNSVEIKKYSTAVEVMERDYSNTVISSRRMKDMLEIDERYRKLARRSTRTPQEEMEYQILHSALGNYMNMSDRLEMDIASQLSPSNMQYMINVNKNLLKSTKDNLYLSVYSTFNTLSKTEDSIMVKNSLIANLDSNLRVAETKYKLGKLSLNSLNLIKLDFQKAKIEINKLQTERLKNIVQLKALIGVSLDKQYIKYENDSIPKEILLTSINDYINSAYENREDYKSAIQYAEIKQKEYEIVKDYHYFETDPNNIKSLNEFAEAKNQLEATKVNVQIQVLNAYTDLQGKLLTLEKNRIAQDLSERALLEAKSKYALGLNTELELSQANINYWQSRLTYLSSHRDAWLAKLKLDLNCGIVINNVK